MNTQIEHESGTPIFSNFNSDASAYLMKVRDKAARLFGLRYAEYLQNEHRNVKVGRCPKPNSPDQRLVSLALAEIFQKHYGSAR